MPECKSCKSSKTVRNGMVRGKQRYRCKECGYNFVEGDGRTDEKIAAKKAMCVIFYLLGKSSYYTLARIFNTWPSLIYRWIKEAGAKLPKEEGPGEIKEMDFDEMWSYVESNKAESGASKRITMAHGELWPGCSAIVILQHTDSPMARRGV